MNGERIRQARELCGFTQTELARRADVAQSAVAQIEADVYEPSEAVLEQIAKQTGFDIAFLKRQDPPANFPLASLLYRSQAKVAACDKARAHRLAQLMFELVLTMRKRLRDIPVMLPRISEDCVTSARLTRSNLGLSPDTPIPSVIGVLERAGVLILRLPLEIDGLDAFSGWAGPLQNIPVVCLLKSRVGYRERLTVSEEIGHLVMHTPLRVSVDEAEKEAKAFAGEFLFPEEAMRRELTSPITLSTLSQSKRRWGCSINFQVVQANRIGLITQNQYRYLMQQLSWKGWRKEEPRDAEVSSEKPIAFLKMAQVVYGSPIDLGKIRKETGIPPTILKSLFQNAPCRIAEVGVGLQLVKKQSKALA